MRPLPRRAQAAAAEHAHGRGKRGGARVIYYVFDENAPIFALLVYGKGDKTNLTADEKAAVRAIAVAIKTTYRSKG